MSRQNSNVFHVIGSPHELHSRITGRSFIHNHLYFRIILFLAFTFCFSVYMNGQYISHYQRHCQYTFDSLPNPNSIMQLKTNMPPYVPAYTFYNPAYKNKKVASVESRSKPGPRLHWRKYDREGYVLEEINNLPYINKEFPDNRGHHYYRYANNCRIVFDSLMRDTAKAALKQQYIFDTAYRLISHRISSTNHLLPDSTNYTYDSLGNCIRIISYYKVYTYDESGALVFLKDGDIIQMNADTFLFSYAFKNNFVSYLVRKDRSFGYGTILNEVQIKYSKPGRTLYRETQTFSASGQLVSIETGRYTVDFYYLKDQVNVEIVYNEVSSATARTTYSFFYDKKGRLKRVQYYTQPYYIPDHYLAQVTTILYKYNKKGLPIQNEFGGKIVYTYY